MTRSSHRSTDAAPAPETTAKRRGMTRRDLCLGVGGVAVLAALGTVKYADAAPVVRPPGGQDETRLLASCIRCEKCIEACPHHVLRPAHIEEGLLATRTPTVDFSTRWCDWCADENGGVPLCVAACPTEALFLPASATAENTLLGEAVINEDWCLATKGMGCRFCYDACPYEAMGLDENGRPFVIAEHCNGCGACESVCVSLSSGSIAEGATARAITVRPLAR